MSTVLTWNVLPPWFEYLEEIKELYIKKYYDRDSNNLPHLHVRKQAGIKTLEEMVKFEEKEKDN